jgi:hypothetical protein
MRSFLANIALCTLVLSCDDNHDESRPTECAQIIAACHEVDKGPGPIHDCHENAEEAWTKDQCVANRSMCLSLCGAGADGGS